MPVSLCLIARNEAANIQRCLGGVAGSVAEILVLDTGSTDNTRQEAEKHGATVFDYNWAEHFGQARNFLVDKAHNDWLLWIDGDEYYPPELLNEIRSLFENGPGFDGYYVPRRNYYFGRWLRHGGNYPDYQLKLFKKSAASTYGENIHEGVRLQGKAGYLVNCCHHYSYPTIDKYIEKNIRYSTLEARKLIAKGIEPSPLSAVKWLVVSPAVRFIRRYIFKGGFLDGYPGLIASLFDAWGYIIRYARLWEIRKNDKQHN